MVNNSFFNATLENVALNQVIGRFMRLSRPAMILIVMTITSMISVLTHFIVSSALPESGGTFLLLLTAASGGMSFLGSIVFCVRFNAMANSWGVGEGHDTKTSVFKR